MSFQNTLYPTNEQSISGELDKLNPAASPSFSWSPWLENSVICDFHGSHDESKVKYPSCAACCSSFHCSIELQVQMRMQRVRHGGEDDASFRRQYPMRRCLSRDNVKIAIDEGSDFALSRVALLSLVRKFRAAGFRQWGARRIHIALRKR
jgi:hypothetical protein